MSTFHLRLKKYSTMGHWYVHADSRVWSPQWLHHLQFSGFNAFQSAPEQSVSWLNWMSLPNKLKRSHTVITLRCKGNLLCMNHNFVYVPCGVCQNGARKKTWYTTDSQIVMFHTSGYIFFVFVFFFRFVFGFILKICSKSKVTMFSERLNASFVLVGAALTFLPIERQRVVKLMLARNKIKDDEMGYNFCLFLFFFTWL